MNIIAKCFYDYCQWVSEWRPASLGFLLQALMLFGLPTVLCCLAYLRGSRLVPVQIIVCAAGVLLAATLPVGRITIPDPIARGWVVALASLFLLFLPGALAQFLIPKAGQQRRVAAVLYTILFFLFLANLFLRKNL